MTEAEQQIINDCLKVSGKVLRNRMLNLGITRDHTADEWTKVAGEIIGKFLIAMPDANLSRLAAFDGSRLHAIGDAVISTP